MKIGFILECQSDGPDEKVIRCLFRKFEPEITGSFAAQGNKANLLRDCGKAARELLADGCKHVVIVWDLHPADWGNALQQKNRVPCLHEDRERIFATLNASGVERDDVSLVAIKYMLETWLLADSQALAAFLTKQVKREISKQQIGSPNMRTETRPKDKLSKIFEQLGYVAYRDFAHAHKIAEEITDIKPLLKSETFTRFWQKTSGLLHER